MGHRLLGKDVDDVLVEFWGPHNGRNHFPSNDAPAPQLRIQVFGADAADAVQVEENTTLKISGTNNSNAIGSSPVRGGKIGVDQDPANWAAVGAPVLVASGMIVLALTARDDPYALRVRVDVKTLGTAGDGSVEVATEWS